MDKVQRRTVDEEGFAVITTIEVLPKVATTYVNGVKLVTHTYKNGDRHVESSCSCMGSTLRTHSRDDCHNRLAMLARRRGAK